MYLLSVSLTELPLLYLFGYVSMFCVPYTFTHCMTWYYTHVCTGCNPPPPTPNTPCHMPPLEEQLAQAVAIKSEYDLMLSGRWAD